MLRVCQLVMACVGHVASHRAIVISPLRASWRAQDGTYVGG